MNSEIPFVCPSCLAVLADQNCQAVCTSCDARFQRMDHAYADFAGPSVSFQDWWMKDEEAMRHWLDTDARKEHKYESGLAKNYILPLLKRLGHEPGSEATILSAGCGFASDVDLLTDAGYKTWGIDIGNRVLGWGERRYQGRLARADMCQMPFPDQSFDFVYSINALEHIGTVGDTSKVTPDYLQQRMRALRSLLRVTKPGGHVLITGLSRTIPFDLLHVQEVRFVRIHSPWERFLLNFADIRQMCSETGEVEWTRPLPLRGFFSWTTLGQYRLVRPLLPVADWLLGCMPDAFYGSFLSPIYIALIRRRSEGSQLPVPQSTIPSGVTI